MVQTRAFISPRAFYVVRVADADDARLPAAAAPLHRRPQPVPKFQVSPRAPLLTQQGTVRSLADVEPATTTMSLRRSTRTRSPEKTSAAARSTSSAPPWTVTSPEDDPRGASSDPRGRRRS